MFSEVEKIIHSGNHIRQKVINLVQDAITNFSNDQKYELEDLGQYIYEVNMCIDIYHPSFTQEVEVLTKLKSVLEQSYENGKETSQEDIREIHFNGWRRDNKFVDIDVKELNDERGWVGTCRTVFDIVEYRETKLLAINAMRTELSRVGYEVGNLPELMGIE